MRNLRHRHLLSLLRVLNQKQCELSLCAGAACVLLRHLTLIPPDSCDGDDVLRSISQCDF